MANSSTKTRTTLSTRSKIELCWTLVGVRQGPFWYAHRRQPTFGKPASVTFDAAWVTARDESHGDILGFYHTHPNGLPTPSKRDDRTMRAWTTSLGRPLLCLIEADRRVHAYLYQQGSLDWTKLAACERLARGVVIVFDGALNHDS